MFRLLTFFILSSLFASLAPAQMPAPTMPIDANLFGPTSPGYIFLTPQSRVQADGYPGSLMILDSSGVPLFNAPLLANSQAPYTNTRPFDFKPQPNGTLTYSYQKTVGTYTFFALDSNFEVVDTITCGSATTDEHELRVTADGHFFIICKEFQTMDASGLTMANGSPGSPNTTVVSNSILEMDENQNILNRWYALDHLPLADHQQDHFIYPGFIDHVHTNAIDFDLDSNYILSQRNMSEITKVNRQTGQVMWRLGGNGNQFTLLGDSVFFDSQHAARIAPNGNLYLYDNAHFGSQQISRYLEYVLDTVNMTATQVREIRHPADLNTAIMGNAQLLEDGHVAISWGGFLNESHPANVSEYDENNNLVMELDFPYNYITYRVDKSPLPFEVERPTITCDNVNQTLSAPAGYDTYEWSTGDTTATISINQTGEYYVWVNKGIGFLRSRKFTVSTLQDICLPVDAPAPFPSSEIVLYPNPTQESTTLHVPESIQANWSLTVSNPLGQIIYQNDFQGKGEFQLEVASWSKGIYFIAVNGKNQRYSGRLEKR